jgi:hypothetical protein
MRRNWRKVSEIEELSGSGSGSVKRVYPVLHEQFPAVNTPWPLHGSTLLDINNIIKGNSQYINKLINKQLIIKIKD